MLGLRLGIRAIPLVLLTFLDEEALAVLLTHDVTSSTGLQPAGGCGGDDMYTQRSVPWLGPVVNLGCDIEDGPNSAVSIGKPCKAGFSLAGL